MARSRRIKDRASASATTRPWRSPRVPRSARSRGAGRVVVHRLLAQQFAKATDESGTVDLERLRDLVSGAYEEYDRDRRRTDRSMSLMIEEIDVVNRNLEQTIVERTGELRARELDLEAQNTRFEAPICHIFQGRLMFHADTRR